MVTVNLTRSRHGPTYKAEIAGYVGRVAVKGRMRPFFHGVDGIEANTVGALCAVNRAEGGALTYGQRAKVIDAVVEALKESEQ